MSYRRFKVFFFNKKIIKVVDFALICLYLKKFYKFFKVIYINIELQTRRVRRVVKCSAI